MKKPILIIIVLCMFASCTSTTLVSSWKAPGATYSREEFKKVMVVALLQDETSRRIAEDRMSLFDSSFIASYMIPGYDKVDTSEAAVNAFLERNQIDGIITMHLRDVNKQLNYVPGTYYGGYYGWYGYYYNGFNSPGYYQQDTEYILETNVYSVKQNKILWSGLTSTIDPVSIQKTVQEVGVEVTNRMRKDGFIIADKK